MMSYLCLFVGYASSFMMNGMNSSLPPPHQPTDVNPSSSIGLSHPFSSAPVSRAMMFGVSMEQDFGSIALGASGVKQENFPMVSGGINRMPGKALIGEWRSSGPSCHRVVSAW